MSETVLVTGGAGFIGSHLVDALLEQGKHVRVLDNLEPQVHGGLAERGERPAYLNSEAEFICGDVRDDEMVRRALQGAAVVFHEAARVGVAQSMYEIAGYTSANTHGAAVLLQAVSAMRERPRKLVVASSMSIYGEGAYRCPEHGLVYPRLRLSDQLQRREWELRCPMTAAGKEGGAVCDQLLTPAPTNEDKPLYPTSVYAINKRDHEELFLTVGAAYGLPATALRYFNVYGTRQALSNPYTGVAAIFSSRLLNGKAPLIYEDGGQLRDFTHVSDIVQANLLAMDSRAADYQALNVGSGRALSIGDMARALSDHFGRDEAEFEIPGQFRAGDIRHCYGDIRRLEGLGYRARMRFEEGIPELVEWVRRQQAEDRSEQARQELNRRGLAV